MAYLTATQGADANPAATLYATLAGGLTTAGFTLVDTQVISTRTHKVWKSAAANNAQGLDWFLDAVYTTTGAGSLWLFPMEFYDPATHLATRMVHGGLSSTTIEQTFYSINGATAFTLESASWPLNASNATGLPLLTSTSSFGYWFSVTGDRVIGLSSVSASSVLYAGMYAPTSYYATNCGAATFPLVVFYWDANNVRVTNSSVPSSTLAAFTRLPKIATGVLNWQNSCSVASAQSVSNALHPPPSSSQSSVIGSTRFVSPVAISSAYTGNLQAVQGYAIGLLSAAGIGATATRGDTVTVGSDSYITGTATATGMWLMKAV